MIIQVHTDNTIKGSETLGDEVRAAITSGLAHSDSRITRVEVHLSDENGRKSGGDDIQCMIEARLEGMVPVAVTHRAAQVGQAVDGGVEKLDRMIRNILDKQRGVSRKRTDPSPSGSEAGEPEA